MHVCESCGRSSIAMSGKRRGSSGKLLDKRELPNKKETFSIRLESDGKKIGFVKRRMFSSEAKEIATILFEGTQKRKPNRKIVCFAFSSESRTIIRVENKS